MQFMLHCYEHLYVYTSKNVEIYSTCLRRLKKIFFYAKNKGESGKKGENCT